jgi:Rrf2 family protein
MLTTIVAGRAGVIITSKSDYGLRAALHLARTGQRARLREISAEQYIPEAVCAQVMRRLVSARLVDSLAGPHGGYTLARSAEEISVASILSASDRDICIFRCVDDGCDCELSGRCAFQVVLQTFGRDLAQRLESMSLADLRDAQAKFPEIALVGAQRAAPSSGAAPLAEVGRIASDAGAARCVPTVGKAS